MSEFSTFVNRAQRVPMPNFDIVVEPNLVEVRNAVDQTGKEIATRFDFKGTSASIALEEDSVGIVADSEFQLGQVRDILLAKLAKRGVDVRFLDLSAESQKIGGDRVRQDIEIKSGVSSELSRKIQGLVKQSKLKVQAAIQGDSVRVSAAKRDDLQATIALLRREVTEAPLGFKNFRE